MASFTFGAPTTTTALGGFNFGSASNSSSGSLFGGGTSTGFAGFGSKIADSTSLFNLGATTTSSTGLFGAPTATSAGLLGSAASTTGGLFGTNTLSGAGLFGAPASSGGLFATSSAPSGSLFGGFGAKQSTGFGSSVTNTTSSGFGTSTFGGTSLFPGFGATTTTSTGFGTAIQPAFGSLGFGQQQQQQQNAIQQQQQLTSILANPLAAMTSALTMPTLYGDERDAIVAKLNQLQALWGKGKAYYSADNPPFDLTPENPFCRFKTVGYSCLPSAKDEDGFLSLDLKHGEAYVKANQQALVEALHKILGSSSTLSICVDGVRALPGEKSEVIIYVVERLANGSSRRILATELYAVLFQPNLKVQLEQLGVENMIAKTALSESQLKQFIKEPPIGIDAILWEQAKKDNPDPRSLIPVPMMGFDELLTRIKHQQFQTQQHQRRIEIISEEIAGLQEAHTTTVAKIAQYKRKHMELGLRVLQVMVDQESRRKVGYTIEPSEEQLRVQLESIQTELNVPMQYKGRLSELMSQVRLQSQLGAGGLSGARFSLRDEELKVEIKKHLSQQQEGLLQLISVIREDFDDLRTIESGILESATYLKR